MVDVFSLRHGTHDSEDDGSNPNIAKATAMCVLFTCSFVLGCLPIKLTRWLVSKSDNKDTAVESNKYVQMLLGLGGGVLLCTTFLHLLPEVAETFEELNLTPNLEIHYAELLMCIGFFIMYFVEECVHVYLHRKEAEALTSPLIRTLSVRRGDTPRCSAHIEPIKEVIVEAHIHNHTAHSHKHTHVVAIEVDSTVKAIRGLLVVLALSVHELFEGLSVGLESSAGNVWYMFGAVAAHKLVIAFCIGVELVTTNMKTYLIVIYVFTFAVVSPMGIGIGMAISNLEENSSDVVSVFLQGLASGTLLYVVFFEILQNERKTGLRQYFSILFGFVCMFGITILG
ncbi:zinc transporter ZIP3-like [Sitophilus oryzae]|uniref:Zinc transporter ZIP3-like n=1 Tax=Sitophilus oryzae TaxID=7048 RepID=A0A6J2XD29_SITOR|nr:zinc transporter ZIP3-like [Sitophilus oryzae]XP_030749150.1 zinc transporter ZIP3-like [Sitophilus oryzae]XP_030749151.1 zinc transporter ZIP3-like [Sitophilus oryzae]XP_030749152.1 zinc transporter ZIP3-like [Sitophilus oryzae]XP_030749153.1 zinc transporter ZIP3-like [Sitophilus oryzae]XP_030749155.1 zinc transporter ZIP3-like [Sitophilus oryzae]